MLQNLNFHRNLRPEPEVGANPDEILSLTDQIVDRCGRKPLADGRGIRHLIKGVPVAPGVAVGQAIVIRNLEDLQRIGPDSILICSRMSPAYSIAFQMVRGIISERGGIMSTAATVARENGLPVVTRLRSAQRIISEGDLFKINGSDGSIQIVLKGFSVPQRVTELALRPDRADVIVPALGIHLKVMKWAGVKKTYVPEAGLADGMVRIFYDKFKQSKSITNQKTVI